MDPKKKAKHTYDYIVQTPPPHPPPPPPPPTTTMTNSTPALQCDIEQNQEEEKEEKDNVEEPDLNEEYDDVSHDQDLQLKLNNRIHYLDVKNTIIQTPLANTTTIHDVLFALFQSLNSNNDNDIVKFSWEKPFVNDIVHGSVPGYIKTLVIDSPDKNLNTRNNYYKEALRDDSEVYYLIKYKNNEKREDIKTQLEKDLASIIEFYFQNYFKKIGIQIPDNMIVVEKIKHGNDFKTKHENILFENYTTYNIHISNGTIKDMIIPDDLDAKIVGFLNHIKSNDNLVLFSFVTCETDQELYNTTIKPTFISEFPSESNQLTNLLFNSNALATFLPLQKFLPRNILPILIARENALKYTFENQQVLIQRGIPTNGDIKNKTLQHSMVYLFFVVKDNIYKYYSDTLGNPSLNLSDYKKCEYKNNMKIIKERGFEMIKWGAKVSDANIRVISNNEQNNTQPYNKTSVENEDNIKKCPRGFDNIVEQVNTMEEDGDSRIESPPTCPVTRTSVNGLNFPIDKSLLLPASEADSIDSSGSNYKFKDCFDIFNDHVLSINPDLNYFEKTIGKLPSLRQLGRLLSTIFCLYLVLYDKGYVSITGGDLFRYLLYDIIKTSADFDFGIFINDDVDKNEIIKKLIESVFVLNTFLYDSYYFYDLKYQFEFDMFYLPPSETPMEPLKQFYIQITCRDRHSNRYYNPFTMRTINNPLKFPVSMVSADVVLQEEISDDPIPASGLSEFSNIGKYIISWLDCVVKTFDKIDPGLYSVVPDTNKRRLIPDLLEVRYLKDPETGAPIKTSTEGFYYTLKPSIETGMGQTPISEIINETNQKLGNDTPLQRYYDTMVNGLFHLNELHPNDALFKILLTPMFNPDGMYRFVYEVTQPPYLEGRIVAGKNDKDQVRLANISNRLNCKIADLSNDVEVINLDGVYENNIDLNDEAHEEDNVEMVSENQSDNSSITSGNENHGNHSGAIFSTLRDILEIMIFKNDNQNTEILSQKINELSDFVFNQKSLEKNDEDAAFVEKAEDSDLESTQSTQITEITTPSMLEQNLQENPIVEFQGLPYLNLVNTKNRSQQKYDPDNITNTLDEFIIRNVDKIYDETVNDNNGRSKTSYIITKLKPPVMEESDDEVPDLEPIPENSGGKRSPGEKRTLKRRRDKKKTRKTSNKKNKSKKRATRINKKRRIPKTRKNV